MPKLAPPAAKARSRRLDPRGPVDLDRRTWQRLRRGRLGLDGRLDLHGMTQAEAHPALAAFLAAAQRRGARCVLVITGRGLVRGGTLREMTPRWLDEPPNRARVVSYARAQLEHGGEGAIYVLLRRPG
jgi:DNA-nicking Smr family endonuclease